MTMLMFSTLVLFILLNLSYNLCLLGFLSIVCEGYFLYQIQYKKNLYYTFHTFRSFIINTQSYVEYLKFWVWSGVPIINLYTCPYYLSKKIF